MAQCKKENIREAILDTALHSFAKNGYNETSIKDIARECGISTGNVYKYFESKADIYENLITDEFLEEMHDLLVKRTIYHIEIIVGTAQPEIEKWFDKTFYPFFIKNALRCIILKNHYLGSEYDKRLDLIVENLLTYKKKTIFRLNQDLPRHFLEISAMTIASNVQMYVQVLEMDKSDDEKKVLLKKIDKYHIAGSKAIYKEN